MDATVDSPGGGSSDAGCACCVVPVRWTTAWLVAVLILATGVLGLCIYRAATQSLVHDEAMTYVQFVSPPAGEAHGYSANNHVLHTWMAKRSVAWFGNSELALRIPALLGAALYLAALVILARRLFQSGLWAFVAVGLASLNPLVLDFLACARGYSLALGFLMWGIVFLSRSMGEGGWNGRVFFSYAAGSLFLGLCVAANLSFVFAAGGVGSVFVLTMLFQRMKPVSVVPSATPACRPRRVGGFPNVLLQLIAASLVLIIPGLCAVAVTYVPYLNEMKKELFYAGHHELRTTARDLLYQQFFYPQTGMGEAPFVSESRPVPDWVAQAVLLLTAAVVVALTVLLLIRWLRRSRSTHSLPTQSSLLLCGAVCVAAGGILFCHFLLDVRYPVERTSIYFVPMVSLGVISGVLELVHGHKWSGRLALALCLLILLRFAGELNVSYFRIWKYDAEAREVFARMEEVGRNLPGPIRVGGCWFYKPSINYYRITRCPDRMLPYRKNVVAPVASYHFLLVNDGMAEELNVKNLSFVPVYHGHHSAITVYANGPALGRAALMPYVLKR